MIPRLTLVFLLAAFQAMAAETPATERAIIVSAIGEMPVPKLKIETIQGFTGYSVDESSVSSIVFPQKWQMAISSKHAELILNLNQAACRIPLGTEDASISIKPSDGGASDAKTFAVPPTTDLGDAVLVLFNAKPDKPWKSHFNGVMVFCPVVDRSKPMATVLNLSGANLLCFDSNKKQQAIAPGKTALALISGNENQSIQMLEMGAQAGGKMINLSANLTDASSPNTPLAVVYPSASAPKNRPLEVAVVQPTYATKVTPVDSKREQ